MENVMGRIHSVESFGALDGPGIRYVLFLQGCPMRCAFCHNPDSWNAQGGEKVGSKAVVADILRYRNFIQKGGVTLSGGEPMEQAEALLPFAREVRARGRDLVIFSGYTFEQLLEMGTRRPAVRELLSLAFLLVDGRFVLAERDLTLSFRGSRNQRLLDPAASLAAGRAIEANV